MVEIPFCPTLPMIEVPLFVQVWYHIILIKMINKWCPERVLSTMHITVAQMTMPPEQ
jgi:hypothetical protein